MIDLAAALSDLADECRALLAEQLVDVPVVVDADAITPPCVYCHLSAVVGFRLASYELEGLVDVVAPNVAAEPAMEHLSRMSGPLIAGLHHAGEAQFVQLAAPGAGAPYATLRIKALIGQA